MEVDNVCGMCEADTVSSSYGMIITDLISSGDFQVSSLVGDCDDSKQKHATIQTVATTASPADTTGHGFRLISQYDLDTCGLDSSSSQSATAIVKSAHDLRRLCWTVASDAIENARTVLGWGLLETLDG